MIFILIHVFLLGKIGNGMNFRASENPLTIMKKNIPHLFFKSSFQRNICQLNFEKDLNSAEIQLMRLVATILSFTLCRGPLKSNQDTFHLAFQWFLMVFLH